MEIVPTMCIFNNDNVQIDINSSSHWHWCYTFLHFVENITDPIDYQHGMHFLRIIKYSLKTCIVHMTQNSKIMKIRMHLFSVESRFTSYVHCFHVKLFFFWIKSLEETKHSTWAATFLQKCKLRLIWICHDDDESLQTYKPRL